MQELSCDIAGLSEGSRCVLEHEIASGVCHDFVLRLYLFYFNSLTIDSLCESGFIPAGLYTITRWYKRDETSKRFSWFFIGNMVAQAISGLVAYGM